jgi:hypothetical protein
VTGINLVNNVEDTTFTAGRCFKLQRLHADKAYDIPHLQKRLRGRHVGVHIARKGIESSERSAPQMGDRANHLLAVRLPQTQPPLRTPPRNYLALLGPAAALWCFKRLLENTVSDTVSSGG